jgi:BON domain
MRRWNSRISVFGLACAGLLIAEIPAFAQSMSGSGGFGGGSSGGSSFGGSSSGFGGSSSGFGGSSSGFGGSSSGFGGGSSSGNSAFGGSATVPGTTSNTSSIPGRSGASAAIGATSFLGAYYGSPFVLSTGNQAKFGSPLYPVTTTGTAQTRITNPSSAYYGAPIGVRRLPAYATTLKIKDMPPPESPLQVRADLQTMLARSGQLDSKDAVRVSVDGSAVVLQGEVADDDERRLVENMVRLTPGVNAVRNELAARNPAP